MSAAVLRTRDPLDPVLTDLSAEAAAIDREARIAPEWFARLHAAGVLGLTLPLRFGGAGQGLLTAARTLTRVAEAEPSTALILSMHMIQHAAGERSARWPEPVQRRIVQAALRDAALINALRVEREQGTPARGGLPATVAARTAEGWRISGRKIFSTGAAHLRWGVVWARTDDPTPLLGQFLVPMDAPGVRIEPSWDHLGMRASESHDVVMTDVLLPADHALDLRPASEWSVEPAQAAWIAVGVAAVYHGVARSARDWLVGYLRERVPSNLGAPLATLPRVQETVGRIEGLLLAAERLLLTTAAAVDRGEVPLGAESGLVKQAVTANAIAAVDLALQLVGNAGLSRTNPLERHWRNVLCGRIHTPQDDSVFLAAGRAALEDAA